MKKELLFICTGNYYRSRFAEIYFQHLSDLLKLDWKSKSRGFEIERADYMADIYGELSPFIRDHLNILNLKEDEGRKRVPLNKSDLDSADLIVILDKGEHNQYLRQYAISEDDLKVIFWNVKDIHDWTPKETISLIENECQKLVNRMWHNEV